MLNDAEIKSKIREFIEDKDYKHQFRYAQDYKYENKLPKEIYYQARNSVLNYIHVTVLCAYGQHLDAGKVSIMICEELDELCNGIFNFERDSYLFNKRRRGNSGI